MRDYTRGRPAAGWSSCAASSTTQARHRAGAATTAPAPRTRAEVSADALGARREHGSTGRASWSNPRRMWPTGDGRAGRTAVGQDPGGRAGRTGARAGAALRHRLGHAAAPAVRRPTTRPSPTTCWVGSSACSPPGAGSGVPTRSCRSVPVAAAAGDIAGHEHRPDRPAALPRRAGACPAHRRRPGEQRPAARRGPRRVRCSRRPGSAGRPRRAAGRRPRRQPVDPHRRRPAAAPGRRRGGAPVRAGAGGADAVRGRPAERRRLRRPAVTRRAGGGGPRTPAGTGASSGTTCSTRSRTGRSPTRRWSRPRSPPARRGSGSG